MLPKSWQSALSEQEAAIEACIAVSRRIPDSEWATPRAEGKWSAAQTLEHVGLAYQMVSDDLNGKPPVRKLPRWKQLYLRTFVLPRMLRTDTFRESIPAPRETRPDRESHGRAELEELLRSRVKICFDAMVEAHARGKRVNHPYFGSMSLMSMLRLGTAHTRHHTRILAKVVEGA
jgi:hypothetical protein